MWNGRSSAVPPAVRVATVTVLPSEPMLNDAAPLSAAVPDSVTLRPHFETSAANTTAYAPAPVFELLATPRWLPSVPALDTCPNRFCACASLTMSLAFLPATRSALRPSATPVAFVVNGLSLSPPLPTVIEPPGCRGSRTRRRSPWRGWRRGGRGRCP